MVTKVDERVMEQTRFTERPARVGEVRDVAREVPPRYGSRWDDGHESAYSASAAALNRCPPHEAE
jgi:hypothetical protein